MRSETPVQTSPDERGESGVVTRIPPSRAPAVALHDDR